MMEFDTNFDPLEKWDIINKVFAPEDIFVIDGFKRAFKFGPENIMDCKCSKCGADQKVSFRFSILEFFPTDTDQSAIRTRILSSKPSKADAQRAKKDVLSKIAMAAQTPPKGTGGTGQRQARARIENVSDAEPTEVAKEVPVTIKPDVNQTGTVSLPKVPANLAARILEEAKHEIELEIEQGPRPFLQFDHWPKMRLCPLTEATCAGFPRWPYSYSLRVSTHYSPPQAGLSYTTQTGNYG
jgi:hypothetical protein